MARFTPLTHHTASGAPLTAIVLAGLVAVLVLCLVPLAVQIDQWLAGRRPRCRRGESNRQIDRWADEEAPRSPREPT